MLPEGWWPRAVLAVLVAAVLLGALLLGQYTSVQLPGASVVLLLVYPLLAKQQQRQQGSNKSNAAFSHALPELACPGDEGQEAEQQQGQEKQASSRRMGGQPHLRPSLLRFLKAVKQRWAKAGEQVRAACAKPASLLPSPLARARMAQAARQSSDGSARSGLWRRTRFRNTAWQPSMARILSGQNLHSMLQDGVETSSISTSTTNTRRTQDMRGSRTSKADAQACREMPLVPHAGHLAVDCMLHDCMQPAAAEVAEVVTNQHLLQFGALLGESSAELALSQAGAPAAQGLAASCLLGPTDDSATWSKGWELVVHESSVTGGLHYWAWRRYLRKGLFMYKSRTVFEGVTPLQLAAFYFDSPAKMQWDDNCTALAAVPAAATAEDEAAQSCHMHAKVRFPTPMAQRDYVYARRVWAKADDCGCYIVSRAASHPLAPTPAGRTVRVTDFVSGTVIREDSTLTDGSSPSAEMVTVYFEDSHVSPGILNLGVRKGLWPHVQKMETALRQHVGSPNGLRMQVATSTALQQALNPALRVHQQQVAGLRRCASMGGHSQARSSCGGSEGLIAQEPHASKSGLVHTYSTPSLAGAAPAVTSTIKGKAASSQLLVTQSQVAASPFAQQAANSSLSTRTYSSVAMTFFGEMMAPVTAALRLARSQYGWLMSRPFWPHTSVTWQQCIQAAANMHWALCKLGYLARGILCWLVRHHPAVEKRLFSLRERAQFKADVLASHPVQFNNAGYPQPGGRGGPRKWGRKLGARLCVLAVKALSVPLAHRMLTRTNTSSMLSRSSSMGGYSQAGGSTLTVHGGQTGMGARTQPTRRDSSARVMSWLDPLAAPDYLFGPNAELLIQQHMALQQLHQQEVQRRTQTSASPRNTKSAGNAPNPTAQATTSRLGLRPSQLAVVDGVPLAWGKPLSPSGGPAVDQGSRARKAGRQPRTPMYML